MKNICKKQKYFILALIGCFVICILAGLFTLEIIPANSVYAQEYNANNAQGIHDYSNSTYLELYNEDGTMQMIPKPVIVQDNNPALKTSLAIQDFNERKLLDSGKPDSESIVVTIMGDGFTASQQDDFIDAASDAVDKMLGNPSKNIEGCYPFNLFRDYFTVYAIEVISNESGVSRDANTNNGVIVDNYFGSSFYYGRDSSTIERALVITNYNRAEQLEKPNSAMTAIICNSTRWGGTGGQFAVLSCAQNYETIMFHEFGHSFGGLADEYYYPSDGVFRGREAPNMTRESDDTSIKWGELIGVDNVGIYPFSEGVNKSDPNFDSNADLWFKPHKNCKMQYSNREFCPVCSDELIRKMMSISEYTPSSIAYTQNGIRVSILNKFSSKWILYVSNRTGETQTFIYNKKMCFEGDAKNWTGLSDIAVFTLEAGGSKIIKIQENYTATHITISYIDGMNRKIFYANQLNESDRRLASYGRVIQGHSYFNNRMSVNIIGKDADTWLIGLTNNTGSNCTFYYNTKMCFEGDAKNWTSLSDIQEIYLENGATTVYPLRISENGTATSIAISYMDGVYRKIFYANNLDASGTMISKASTIDTTNPPDSCLAEGSLITLADGSQKAVEDLTGDEMLLVWDLHTGTFGSAPILCIDSDPVGHYQVIQLSFSDGTAVDVISEHGFFDIDLNEYVYLDKDAAEYIGHDFWKQGTNGMTAVTLVDVEIETEVTVAYSPVTYGHLCYYVNGMLSMPGGIGGLFNIFEVDAETMTYDAEGMAADIEEYGLYTYEELNALVPVPEIMFDAVNGQYLKVAVGKGMITLEQIGELVDRYSDLFV